MNTKLGLIGFFDILGYQNILKNNEPEVIAEKVLSLLARIGDHTTTSVLSRLNERDQALYAHHKDMIEWLVFSDTILMTLEVVPGITKDADTLCTSFLLTCGSLQYGLFNSGLPLRSAITYGKYLTHKSCFAGQPIIDAYQTASELEASICVIMPAAKETFNRTKNGKWIDENFLLPYLVPLKNEKHKQMDTLLYMGLEENECARELTFQSFFQHNKDIPQDAQTKVLNTEQHIRRMHIALKERKLQTVKS